MGILIDTSALVDIQRRGRHLDEFAGGESADACLPASALAELWIGVELAPTPAVREQRARATRGLIEGLRIVPFTAELAEPYARLYAELRQLGTLIPANDLAIATTALHEGHELLVGSNDEAHFRAVPGLRVRAL